MPSIFHLWLGNLLAESACLLTVRRSPWLTRYLALDVVLSAEVWLCCNWAVGHGFARTPEYADWYAWTYIVAQSTLVPLQIMEGLEVLPQPRKGVAFAVLLLAGIVGAAALQPECRWP